MNNRFEIRNRRDRQFTPRVTPLAERVDTADAALEFPLEEPAHFVPERPAPRVPRAPQVAPAPRVPRAPRVAPTPRVPPVSARPPRGIVSFVQRARLLWLALAVGSCAPTVWLALRDRAEPPQTPVVQATTVQTTTAQTTTAQAATPPLQARPPQDQIGVTSPAPQKPSEPSPTIERRRARPRDNAPVLVARAAPPTVPVALPRAPEPPSTSVSSSGFHGAVLVVSEPPGARVFVNGRPVGSTPLDLPDVPVGSRVVRVEADGYEAWASAIRVVANQQTRVEAVLRR